MKISKNLSLGAAVIIFVPALIYALFEKENRPSSNEAVVISTHTAEPTVEETASENVPAQSTVGSQEEIRDEAHDEVDKSTSFDGQRSFEELAAIVLDGKLDRDFRREALAELTQAGPEAIPLLAKIAATDVPMPKEVKDPHSAEVRRYEYEKGLRFTALEAIDDWAAKNVDVGPVLKEILGKTRDQDIRFLAFVSLRGVEQGRPGKLIRFVDRMMDEFEDSLQ